MSHSLNVRPQEQQALLHLLPDGAAKQKVITSMAKNAAENFDVQRAEELLQMLPPDQGGAIYTTLADHWTDNDPAAADAWIATLPPGSAERSWAEVGRVQRLLIEHNPAAVTFVDRITEPTARRQAVKAIAQWWNRSDPNGLHGWLAQRTELTPIERMELEAGF